MLLVDDVSVSAAERAARVWRTRETIEREAALVFDAIAVELDRHAATTLATRARRAAEDERRHASRCRALVEALDTAAGPAAAPRALVLGPLDLEPRDRALYAAVALGCVTESLSCALLLALRETATHELVVQTVDHIVRDEIEHARVGWAVLETEAARRDVSWLAAHVPAMRRAAVTEDVEPMTGDDDLSGLGVLPRARVQELVSETWATVIGPGLARHGVAVP